MAESVKELEDIKEAIDDIKDNFATKAEVEAVRTEIKPLRLIVYGGVGTTATILVGYAVAHLFG